MSTCDEWCNVRLMHCLHSSVRRLRTSAEKIKAEDKELGDLKTERRKPVFLIFSWFVLKFENKLTARLSAVLIIETWDCIEPPCVFFCWMNMVVGTEYPILVKSKLSHPFQDGVWFRPISSTPIWIHLNWKGFIPYINLKQVFTCEAFKCDVLHVKKYISTAWQTRKIIQNSLTFLTDAELN